ncbi:MULTISPECIES: type IV toxin-antitoxin system AbiEi family antitoxin domain-containing protein [unclassified Oceanispirochaeta]|uniref:type IV toxin-antitoxin system AbiEi family antitoxin domain-containing protein n=1 Tax=unclassified Oceanispirochaeta TaxID=2635722 RepID=UPI000E0916F9|nr:MULTISPECIES: type IV toxin-antitoxin system AbiEi family antitoxin domain-containing protein [unclassified Oceanispirochaeta]MBF9015178.1 type IV toxin-antitoxin system AbiEi family antitoxin domain-containing protein [Oceanispirochaeta sp. M2]NPD71636.1 hypothetical protein [Oceanispirochaeta sp. M1]RDG33203.1 hypothetical protein DV872_05940 [Oceanispirochaeta sp. M1]
MSEVNAPNINKLLQNWEKNSYKTSLELSALGYRPQLLNRYKRSGWLVSPSKGVYGLAGQTVDWSGALYALQKGMNLSLSPKGLFALEQEGFSQYLSMGERRIFLYGHSVKELPQWFRKMMTNEAVTIKTRNFMQMKDLPYLSRSFGDFSLDISAPELAYLEMLDEVPRNIGFSEARDITENLTMLRASLLQNLLEHSSSVKVNRLALYMAEYHQHDWFSKLNPDSISLGAGKRVIRVAGVLDKKYNITVPTPPLEDESYV